MYKTIAFTKQTQKYPAINAMEYIKINIDNYQYKDEIDDQAIVNLFNQFNKEDLLKQPKPIQIFGWRKKNTFFTCSFYKEKKQICLF